MPSKKTKDMGTILGAEDEEPVEPKPPQAKRPARKPQTMEIDNKALRDMLTRMASMEEHDLQQLTDLPLKLIDPIAKGLAYYDATILELNEQCEELLRWYIERCDDDIEVCKNLIEKAKKDKEDLEAKEKLEKEAKAKEVKIPAPAVATPNKKGALKPVKIKPVKPQERSLFDKIFGVKPKVDPELEILNLEDRKLMLIQRQLDLAAELGELEEIDTSEMFFKKWAHHLFLNRRSLGGHAFDGLISLADAQIVTQQEGSLDKYGSIFSR